MEKFANLKKIGEGGFGEVYKATEKLTGKTCALKRIKEINQSALDEVEALQTVRNHPNIANIQSYFISHSSLWVVTGFCEGGDLNEYFWDKKPDVNVKFRFMKQMTSAVAFLHDKGVAHRDLKPENILIALDVNREPQVQLADFGIAKIHCGEQMTSQFMTTCAGTAFFIAPEVLNAARGGRYTNKADLFSLGVIFRALVFDVGLPCGENKKYLVACFIVEGNPIPYSQAMICNKNLEIKVPADLLESSSARQLIDGMLLRNETLRLSAKAVSEALSRMNPSDFLEKPSATAKRTATASPDSESAAASGGALLSRFTQTVRTVKPKQKQSDDVSPARRLTDLLLQYPKKDLITIKQQILIVFITLCRNVSPVGKLKLQEWVLPVINGLEKLYRGERLGEEEAAKFAVGWLQFHSIWKK